MRTISVYQTLKDKDYLSVEENGPFLCNWPNTWLGDGYYFWEEFIENAHWWGENRRGGSYIICRAECELSDLCLDLVGNMSDVRMFSEVIKEFEKKGLSDKSTTVSRIITFMRNELKSFKYDAIRVYGINSISPLTELGKRFSKRILFEVDKIGYYDALPPVQICFYKKTSLNLRNYRIVFPDHYCEDYVF